MYPTTPQVVEVIYKNKQQTHKKKKKKKISTHSDFAQWSKFQNRLLYKL
jgi:hypothetical protein